MGVGVTALGEEIKASIKELGEEIKASNKELGEEIKASNKELGGEIKKLGEEIKAQGVEQKEARVLLVQILERLPLMRSRAQSSVGDSPPQGPPPPSQQGLQLPYSGPSTVSSISHSSSVHSASVP